LALLCALPLTFGVLTACGDDAEEAVDDPAATTGDADDGGTAAGPSETDDATEADDPSADSSGDAGTDFPVTIESDGGAWTLDQAPERVVSLSPTATELLFAIGAGDQVVAADQFSNYPAEAPTTDLSGFDPNLEAITAYEPDLVIIANDANDLIAGLTALDIPVLVSPAPVDLEQGYDELALLGLATGRVDETASVVADLRADIETAFALAPEDSIRIYHELDDTYFSASSNSFIGAVYAGMGATNVADEADTAGSGFPQLAEEYIVAADPEVIIITDQVGYTPDDVAARPGWETISAVQNGDIVVVEADVASRWGPRLPQFITAVADALTSVDAAGVSG
jgi:iron complex transport system substrate-binding protein